MSKTKSCQTPKTKLWVDDLRNPPDFSYDIARTYNKAISLLSTNTYTEIWLDHDLGDATSTRERTGYDVLLWIVQRKIDGAFVPSVFHLLTANPVGRAKMAGVIDRYLAGAAD